MGRERPPWGVGPHIAPSSIDGPRCPPPQGAAAGAMAIGRGLRHLRMALGTIGDFAPCAARVFRPLRRATKGAAFGNRDFLKKIE